MSETANDRLRLILGDERLAALQATRVMVLGLGGVGSSCAEALARGGIGRLVLVDRDGNIVKRFHPTTTPETIDAEIAKLLK